MLNRKNDDRLSQYLISDYPKQTERKIEQNPTTAATSYMIRNLGVHMEKNPPLSHTEKENQYKYSRTLIYNPKL